MISRWARVHTRSVPSKSILSRRRSPKSFLVLFGALEIYPHKSRVHTRLVRTYEHDSGDIYPVKTVLPLWGKRTGGGAWGARF